MAMVDDALESARQLARQISTASPDTPVPTPEITRLREHLAVPERYSEILAVLQSDALACLDQTPREALGLARVAYELARTTTDDRAQTEIELALAIVLNRMGEFRDALAKSRSATAGFEKRGEKQHAARSYWEAAWANSFLGHLEATLEDIACARERDASSISQARCDWIQARVLRDQGKYPEAEQVFEKSRAVFESAGMPMHAARCTRELAHTFLFSGHGDAISLLQSARQRFESVSCLSDVALCDYFLAQALQQSGMLSKSIDGLLTLRDQLSRLGLLFYAALCDNGLGIGYYSTNRLDESFELLRRARDYFLTHAVLVEVSVCDINIGLTCDALNRYDEALVFYQEAADLSLQQGREVRAGRIFNNMGLTYGKQGLYARAIDFHQRALQVYNDRGLESLAGTALVRLAIACRRVGQNEQAIEHLQSARKVFLDRNLGIELAECEFNLADVYFALHESIDAVKHLHSAREIYAENDLESLVAMCDRLLARIASEKGDRAHALSLLVESRAIFLKHDQIVDAALCDLAEGELHLEWNDREPAQQQFVRAQAVLSQGFPDYAWRIASGLGDCARMSGKPAVALKDYLDAVRIIAQSRAALVTEQLSNDYFSSRQSVYDRALKIAKELNTPESALEIVEASKARTLLSLLESRPWNISNGGSDPAIAPLLTREKELGYQLDALRNSARVTPPSDQQDALRGDADSAVSTAALQKLNALSQAYESVVTRLRLASSGKADVSSQSPFEFDRFREAANARFGTDWAALDYYLSGDCLTTAVVRTDGLVVESKTLSPYDRAILDKCASGDPDTRELIYRGTLRGEPAPSPGPGFLSYLGRLLIPEGLDVETLIIAPHGLLHTLPFHALITPRDNRYLIERHKIIYAPSLQVLQLLLSKPTTGVPQRPLVLGLSDFEQALPALAASKDEVERVRQIFGGHVETWWQDQATRQRLLALNAAGELIKFDLLHFATHAILDGLAPHHSHVVLHGDALTALDILNLELNARLVTLSACQTALGKIGRGDEITGLARAFFSAGAQALLATLWNVEDRSTVELIGHFYQHLADGIDAAESLCQAQREMIRAGSPPYCWAAFELMGQP